MDEVLNIVVFGESLLNDGVAVVLYHMFEAYVEIGEEDVNSTHILKGLASFVVVAGGGTAIGIIIGYLCAFFTRSTFSWKYYSGQYLEIFLDFSTTPE